MVVKKQECQLWKQGTVSVGHKSRRGWTVCSARLQLRSWLGLWSRLGLNSGRIHFQSHMGAGSFKFLMRVMLRASVSCLLLTGSCPQLVATRPFPQAAHNIATSFKANKGKSIFSRERNVCYERKSQSWMLTMTKGIWEPRERCRQEQPTEILALPSFSPFIQSWRS